MQHFTRMSTLRTPKFKMASAGLNASLNLPKELRIPISAVNVQSLILHAVIDDDTIDHPLELFEIDNKSDLSTVLVLIVENVSLQEFEESSEIFQQTNWIFQDKMEMLNPIIEGNTLSLALAYIPLTIGSMRKIAQACGTLDNAVKSGAIHNINHLTRKAPLKSQEIAMKSSGRFHEDIFSNSGRSCSLLDLLLNFSELVTEHYPVPGLPEFQCFLSTSKEYQIISDQSPMFSLDCEWVSCKAGNKGLARVALVDEHLRCVYHTLVKPKLPIIDYHTRFSGITEEMLENVDTTLEEVQRDLRKLLPPDAVIVGHAVGNDLTVLKLLHPYIIDTSTIYNLSGNRAIKTKLATLTHIFLQKQIQQSSSGHNPVEDAIAAMELVQLKLTKGVGFGDVLHNYKKVTKRQFTNAINSNVFSSLNQLFQDPNYDNLHLNERMYHPECYLHQKLFTLIQWNNVSSKLISRSDYLDHYNPSIRSIYPGWITRITMMANTNSKVELVPSHNLKEAVQHAVDSLGQKKLTIIHTTINSNKNIGRKKELHELDQSIGHLFKKMSFKGLMIVVFSGKRHPLQNGLCLVRI